MPNPGVIPRESPTVPTAEAASNKHVRIGRSSVILIINPPTPLNVIYIKKTVAAFLSTSPFILRPKKLASSLRRKVAIAIANNTAIVVVFIPPAVEPGLPPISIKIIVINCPASLIDVKSTVLNPAVRGVTD